MAINSLDEITCDTSLSDILKSDDIKEKLKCIDGRSAIMNNINDRQRAINVAGTSGGLSTAIMVDGKYDCLEYGSEIIEKYNACGDCFEEVCKRVGELAEEQELKELYELKTKVEEKLQSIQNDIKNINNLGKDAKDYESKVSNCRHEMSRYDTKLIQIVSRIGKLNPEIYVAGNTAGAGETGLRGPYGPLEVFHTGSDDNNKIYGASKDIVDEDMLMDLLSSDNRSKWVLAQCKIGANGWVSTKGDKYYDCYNNYFTTKVTCKDGLERTMYVICPSSGHGTGDEKNLRDNSIPILYVTEDSYGHKICYDKEGNAISYNNAMNILEISRCSNPNSKGLNCTWDKRQPTVENEPTPYCPTANYTQETSEYTWSPSKEDVNGNVWKKFGNNNFDGSDKWEDYDLSKSHYKNFVFSKENGDAGTINVILNSKNSEVRYYSVKSPDGSYSYYDQSCKPLSEEEVSEGIKVYFG